MIKLFETVEDLQRSGYIFRITDNGGRTFDRFTIVYCDGDYLGASTNPTHPQGFGQHGEGIDVQMLAERVESGEERDLRWIDLPEAVRNCILSSLNQAFADWLESFEAPEDRAAAENNEGLTDSYGQGIYRRGAEFWIKTEHYPDDGTGPNDSGPYETIREAALNTLPMDYSLSGPEYHPTVDIWEEGEARPLWDYEEEEQEEES